MIGYIAVCDKCGQHPTVDISSFKDGAVRAAKYVGWKVDPNDKVKCPSCIKNKGR